MCAHPFSDRCSCPAQSRTPSSPPSSPVLFTRPGKQEELLLCWTCWPTRNAQTYALQLSKCVKHTELFLVHCRHLAITLSAICPIYEQVEPESVVLRPMLAPRANCLVNANKLIKINSKLCNWLSSEQCSIYLHSSFYPGHPTHSTLGSKINLSWCPGQATLLDWVRERSAAFDWSWRSH